MARLFTLGFEEKNSIVLTGADVFSSVTGRNTTGSNTGFATQVGTNQNIWRDFTAVNEVYCAIAVQPGNTTTNTEHLSLRDASGNAVLRLTWGSSTVITYGLGAATPFSGTTVGTFTMPAQGSGTWRLIEIHFKLHASTGAFECRIDGTVDFNVSGINTDPDTRTNMARFRAGSGAGAGNMQFDDMILNDTSGGADNSWIGDIRVVMLTPNGNGASSQFTGSDGNSTDNYLLVDEVPHNSDTDYVQDATSGHVDSYAMSNLPTMATGDTVVAVRGIAIAKRANASVSGSQRVNIKSSGSTNNGSDVALGTNYDVVYGNRLTTDPNTSAAWTETNVNAIECQIEVR